MIENKRGRKQTTDCCDRILSKSPLKLGHLINNYHGNDRSTMSNS